MDDARIYIRSEVLMAQHALSVEDLANYLARCPKEHRWALGGWLRGGRELDGDLIQSTVAANGR